MSLTAWVQVVTSLLNVLVLLGIAWRGGHTIGIILTKLEYFDKAGTNQIAQLATKADRTDVDRAHGKIRDLDGKVDILDRRVSRTEWMLNLNPDDV